MWYKFVVIHHLLDALTHSNKSGVNMSAKSSVLKFSGCRWVQENLSVTQIFDLVKYEKHCLLNYQLLNLHELPRILFWGQTCDIMDLFLALHLKFMPNGPWYIW